MKKFNSQNRNINNISRGRGVNPRRRGTQQFMRGGLNRNRRFRYKFVARRRRNNVNNNKKQKNLNNKINKLSDQISKLSLSMDPKTTNLNRKKKEPRTDILISPMKMGLSSRFASIFRTSNRIRYTSLYTRWTLSTSQAYSGSLMWFPYSVNFTTFPDSSCQVNNNYLCDTLSNMVVVNAGNMIVVPVSPLGLVGIYRVIGCTMKITNTNPMVSKEGSYMCYKYLDRKLYPIFYHRQSPPNKTNCARYYANLLLQAGLNHNQELLKQSYSASDTALIDEYNTYEGNNIFQQPNEYLGVAFISSDEYAADYNFNPTGSPVVYQIEFAPTSGAVNNYLIETWQILEVVPNVGLGLGNVAEIQTHIFDDKIIQEMREHNPFSKA